MDLQGRNLTLKMRGPDVDLLQQELRALGFDIAADETGFGQATRKAVVAIQEQEGLAPTGIVDEATASAINRQFRPRARRWRISFQR
jgi:peptidoglycan hydrolase-like protein with peptidoglycan-binding domain